MVIDMTLITHFLSITQLDQNKAINSVELIAFQD